MIFPQTNLLTYFNLPPLVPKPVFKQERFGSVASVQQNETKQVVALCFPQSLINTLLSLSFQMATLLCTPQFIALNFLAHTFVSGHCSLRHARGRALIRHSMPPWNCSLCKWLFFCTHSKNGSCWVVRLCIFVGAAVTDTWLWLSR